MICSPRCKVRHVAIVPSATGSHIGSIPYSSIQTAHCAIHNVGNGYASHCMIDFSFYTNFQVVLYDTEISFLTINQ